MPKVAPKGAVVFPHFPHPLQNNQPTFRAHLFAMNEGHYGLRQETIQLQSTSCNNNHFTYAIGVAAQREEEQNGYEIAIHQM